MSHWLAEIRVDLRSGIADPEGGTVTEALRALGYVSVEDVRFGKLLHVRFGADDADQAEQLVSDMIHRLLANPVMEVAHWEIRPERGDGTA